VALFGDTMLQVEDDDVAVYCINGHDVGVPMLHGLHVAPSASNTSNAAERHFLTLMVNMANL